MARGLRRRNAPSCRGKTPRVHCEGGIHRADRGLGVAGGGTECAKVTGRRARPQSGRIWKAAFASFVERGSPARPACPSLARRGRFFLNYNRGLCKSDLHCK